MGPVQNPRAAEMEPKAIDEAKLTAADNEEGSPGGKSATELELKAIDETKLTAADNEEGSPDEKSAAEVELKGIDKDEPSDPKKEQESAGGEDGHEVGVACQLVFFLELTIRRPFRNRALPS